jgi:DMSO reductase family type II enzyme chaperone
MDVTARATGGDGGAASRSRIYLLLAQAFTFPDEDLFASINTGEFALAVAEAGRGLPYALGGADVAGLGSAGDSYLAFESEYIRLFDVGPMGPPCPLYGGVYGGDRMKVMEDATRFYNFFHLRMAAPGQDLPDHITTELEFLHYLTFREGLARQEGVEPGSLLRAQRDFLARHLCRWVPQLEARLPKQDPAPFFAALVRFAAGFLQQDRAYAEAAAA